MDITFISDTHNKHPFFSESLRNGGHVIVCCGDITSKGEEGELKRFISWYDQLAFTHKILIAGNHDFIFEQMPALAKKYLRSTGIIYLQDAEVIIDGIKFYGSPVTPVYLNWAFNCHRGKEIKKHWNKIPADTQVLITHGPPYGILDTTVGNLKVGCEDLLATVNTIKPVIHAFGHIHEAYGITTKNKIQFINASLLNENYQPINRPVKFNIS